MVGFIILCLTDLDFVFLWETLFDFVELCLTLLNFFLTLFKLRSYAQILCLFYFCMMICCLGCVILFKNQNSNFSIWNQVVSRCNKESPKVENLNFSFLEPLFYPFIIDSLFISNFFHLWGSRYSKYLACIKAVSTMNPKNKNKTNLSNTTQKSFKHFLSFLWWFWV